MAREKDAKRASGSSMTEMVVRTTMRRRRTMTTHVGQARKRDGNDIGAKRDTPAIAWLARDSVSPSPSLSFSLSLSLSLSCFFLLTWLLANVYAAPHSIFRRRPARSSGRDPAGQHTARAARVYPLVEPGSLDRRDSCPGTPRAQRR